MYNMQWHTLHLANIAKIILAAIQHHKVMTFDVLNGTHLSNEVNIAVYNRCSWLCQQHRFFFLAQMLIVLSKRNSHSLSIILKSRNIVTKLFCQRLLHTCKHTASHINIFRSLVWEVLVSKSKHNLCTICPCFNGSRLSHMAMQSYDLKIIHLSNHIKSLLQVVAIHVYTKTRYKRLPDIDVHP